MPEAHPAENTATSSNGLTTQERFITTSSDTVHANGRAAPSLVTPEIPKRSRRHDENAQKAKRLQIGAIARLAARAELVAGLAASGDCCDGDQQEEEE